MLEHALKRGNSGYPAYHFIAHHVFPTPPHSENAIKLTLYSLPACSLKVKRACAIWIYSEPLNKCVKDIPRGRWKRPPLTSLVGVYADGQAPWQYTSSVYCKLIFVLYNKEQKIGICLDR